MSTPVKSASSTNEKHSRAEGGFATIFTDIWHLTKYEIKLFVREPAAMFFTLVFPLMMLLFVGVVYGSQILDGVRYIDLYFPTLMAAVAANLGVMAIPINISELRTRGVLRRYKVSPFSFNTFMWSQIGVGLFMYLLSCLGIIVMIAAVYGFNLKGSFFLFIAVLMLALAFMMSIGFFLGGLKASARTTQLMGTALFFFMFFGSGAAIPRQEFPPWMRTVTAYDPLTPISDSLVGIYLGYSIRSKLPALGVIFLATVLIIVVTRKTFSWEKN